MRRSRKRDHLTVEKGDAAMTRPSSARRKGTGQPKSTAVLTTISFCVQCKRRLPRDAAKDSPLAALGDLCSVCDEPLCPTCLKAKVGDEESTLLKHYQEDESYAAQRLAALLVPDDHDRGAEIVEEIVGDRVASIMTATQPILRMMTMTKLSRARKGVSPIAYALDQIVLARLHTLRLRGEFKPSSYNMLPTRLSPTFPYLLSNGDTVASPATMKRTVKFYVTPTDPGFPPPKDKDTWV